MNNLLPEVLQANNGSSGPHAGDESYTNPFGHADVEEETSACGSSRDEEGEETAITIVESVDAADEDDGGGDLRREDNKDAKEKIKKKWKASVELATVESRSRKSKQWVPDNDMVEFFRSITEIDEHLNEMEKEIVELEALHMKSKITTNISVVKDMRESMGEHIQTASQTSKVILNKFSEIENTRKAKLSALSAQKLRMRLTIFSAKRKQFKKTMSKFSNLRLTVQADYKEIVTRRYETVTGQTPTDEEVNNMIETGESETIFQKAILEQGRGQIQDTLNEIDERYRSMQQIERGLLELQQIFIDLATVVDQQGEVIDNIETHVNTASEFTSEGAKALQVSAALHKSIQRKKLCIAILVIIGLVILGLVLWPIISKAIDTANAQTIAKAQRRAAAQEKLREDFERRKYNMTMGG